MSEKNFNSQKVYKAAQVLNLGSKASKEEIKANYRKMLKKWHPDSCTHSQKKCKEKIEEIVNAYEIIKKYCDNYLYSFEKDEIINNLPVDMRLEEIWEKRFKGKI
ncbi:MAG: J domain-containing protein [Bacillota bacterium]